MKTFTEWLAEETKAEKPKDKKTLSCDEKQLKRNKEHIERPGQPSI